VSQACKRGTVGWLGNVDHRRRGSIHRDAQPLETPSSSGDGRDDLLATMSNEYSVR
jgi:hypothetical protein